MIRLLNLSRKEIVQFIQHRSLAKPCAPCPPAVSSNPSTQVEVLHNSVKVATEERPSSPLACISIVTSGGPRFEVACNNGIFHFIEHLAYTGYHNVKKQCLEACLLGNMSHLTVTTRRERQTFTALGPASVHELLFEYLAKVITELELSEEECRLARIRVREEALDAEEDPKKLVFDFLHQCAFQGTPLGQRIIGHTCNYERFKNPFLRDFMTCHYQPWKILVASSGAVCHENMKRLTQQYFGCLKPTQCQPPFRDKRYTGSSVIYRNDAMEYAHVILAIEAPGICDPDYLTMVVGKNMIGSWDRGQPGGRENANPLAQAIANTDACDMYEGFYIAYRDVGLWGVYFVGKRMSLETTIFLIQDYWMKMCTLITDGEIKRAVNLTMLDIGKRYDGVINSCKDVGKQVFYNGQRLEYARMASKVSGMKAAHLKDSMMEIVYDKCPVLAAVGPTENIPEYTRIRAGMYWLRI